MSSSVSLRFRASAKAAVTRSAAGCGSAVPFSAVSTQENVSVPSPTAIRHVPARSHRSGSSSAAARKCPVSRPLFSSSARSTPMESAAVSSAFISTVRPCGVNGRYRSRKFARSLSLSVVTSESSGCSCGTGSVSTGAVPSGGVSLSARPTSIRPSISRHNSRHTPRMTV